MTAPRAWVFSGAVSAARSSRAYQQNVYASSAGLTDAPRDALGFKRIGRVPRSGNLKSYPDRLVDAIIYGRDLTPGEDDNDELVSDERFDKIKFYLKHGKYPDGADRAEKSRLRSAATHYKLLENDVLMLKDKEVISDPAQQYEIARQTHALGQHAGINKTTATITERYHWRGIKDTVSDVIRVCAECEDKSNTASMKPSTPNQTSLPYPLPPTSASSLSTGKASQDIRHQEPQSNSFLRYQKPPSSYIPSLSYNEPPIDPQIMNQQDPDQPSHPIHSGFYGPLQQNLQQPCFSPQADMDLDPEAHALLHLLDATSPIQYDEEHRDISDQDLEMMLTRQLEEEADTGGATKSIDNTAHLASDY